MRLEYAVSINGVVKFDKERNSFFGTMLTRKTGLLYLIEVAWNLSAYFTKHFNWNYKHFLILHEFKTSTCSIIPLNL